MNEDCVVGEIFFVESEDTTGYFENEVIKKDKAFGISHKNIILMNQNDYILMKFHVLTRSVSNIYNR